ncbi:pyruvate dehydrogenase e1 component subunit alpha-3, chloroplastic [Nicotiana attenuata]|uniref:Pyruvate dehydrogenase e1 component subunit alpha-3, chloroplastic n=1 Tax=Nicotiana attenuata TaxID=49451 RepID=A0A1J6J1U9_NICAT|nr:pyruvate dehydrogenase e1 component subunit alpha-3, chloroplastic [Nicotiana attenuata]
MAIIMNHELLGAANLCQYYSGDATYRANNSYGYGNSGYGAYHIGYQLQFNQRYPPYTSNFIPQHPCQVSSAQHVPYIYQPSDFAVAIPNCWTSGGVSERAAAMGSVADTRMIGPNCRFEHPSPSVSFHCQQFPVSTSISDFSPKDLWIDEVNPTVIHSNTSNEERPSRTYVAESCNDAISEVSLKTILLSSSIVNVHHPHLTNSSPICEFGADTISSQEVCVARTSILDVTVANNKDISSMNLDMEVDLEEHGAYKDENKFVCNSPLDVNAHKMFDEMSVNEIGEPFDEPVSPKMNEIKEMQSHYHVPAAVATAVVAEKNHHVMQDPITTWKKYMSEENLTSEVELKGIDKKIDKLVKEVEFADASPVRDHSQLLEHVFADPRSCRIGPDPRHKVMTGVLAREENKEGLQCSKQLLTNQIVIQSIPKNTKSIGSRVEFLLKLFESKLYEKSCFPSDANTLLKGRAIPDRTAGWLMSITAKFQDFLVLGRYLMIGDPGGNVTLEDKGDLKGRDLIRFKLEVPHFHSLHFDSFSFSNYTVAPLLF